MAIENWKTFKLEDLGAIITGKTPSSKNPEHFGSHLPFVTPTDFSDYHKNASCASRSLSLEGAKVFKSKILPPNSILVTCIGSQMGKVVVNKTEVLTNQQLNSVIPHKNLNSDFLYYKLSSIHEQLRTMAGAGSTMPMLNKTDFGKIEIEIPEIEEQKAIASILSALDDKIENNLQINKTLEEMAIALYKHWFVDFGPFQDGEFVDSELGKIPKGWEVKELSDLINLNPRLKLTKGIEASFVEMKALPIDVMSVSQIASKKFKGGTKFQNGDTLFARITPCLENGKTAFVDFLDNDEIAFGSTEFLVMRAKKGVSKYWTYCLARERNFRLFSISTMVGTSGRQRVQNDPFLSYQLAVPSMEVYSEFTENVEPWFQKIRTNTLENKTLTQLRDTLLPKLISGEVRVKDVEKTLSEVL